jgi:hypothetical protein
MSKKKGLWDRVHEKRKRGESPSKPGEKNYPKTLNVESINQRYCPRCGKNETREECKYGGAYWDMFSSPISLGSNRGKYSISQVHPANEEVKLDERSLTPQEESEKEDYVKGMKKSKSDFKKRYGKDAESVMYATATKMAKEEKEKDHEYEMANRESSIVIDAAKRIRKKTKGKEKNLPAWVQSKITRAADYADSAADYLDTEGGVKEQKAFKNFVEESAKNIEPPKERLKTDNNMFSIPKDEQSAARERILAKAKKKREMKEDWQKVNKKDKTDGMSQKAVNAYKKENPGSKLKTAVTEDDPSPGRSKRRKSFCARSKGQQDMHNIDCSKDPDKPVCKARRRWKC